MDHRRVAAMTEAMVHRGPDGRGELRRAGACLGMRRLAIIDLIGGDQPQSNEDDTVHVVQNGEIYNYRELREELRGRGHRLRSDSDTEVLVHLYEDLGPAFVERLRGMFALAVWDERRRRLLLARDRFGIKPLFYACSERASGRGATLAFASELTALALAGEGVPDLDPAALEAYLAFNSIPAPLSVLAGHRKLPPGHSLIVEDGAVRVERFGRPRPVDAGRLRRDGTSVLVAELLERLRDSVRAHLIADVPVGVLLSGGIDSSLITALAAREAGAGLRTFSIAFHERTFDESNRAHAVSEQFGTEHRPLVVEPDAIALLPRIVAALDEPLGDSSLLPTFLVSELAASEVKVVLTGEGADELFGGYETYLADVVADRLAPLARVLGPAIERLPSSSRRVSLEYRAKRFARAADLPPLERHLAWKLIFSSEQRTQLLGGRDRDGADPMAVYRARYTETAGAEPLSRMQDLDLGVYLVDDLLVKTDRMSMAHSLEARVPYLDPVVSELALALPREERVRGLTKKRLLRRAAATLLPADIVHGRKRGFSIPAAAWLRGPMAPFMREVLSPSNLSSQGVLDAAVVEHLIEAHLSRREDLSRQLWGLMTLTLWIDEHLPAISRARSAAASV
ncbi:MAG: asparagine synthase (glutamine-hydrolyzing) [Actinomycetota bacterium]|nr:asparagine synthase (glutamine-hydrolyzing) [Actinomycetota bacterium]